jgi:hypothetical protein
MGLELKRRWTSQDEKPPSRDRRMHALVELKYLHMAVERIVILARLDGDSFANKQSRSARLDDDSFANKQSRSARLDGDSFANKQSRLARLDDDTFENKQSRLGRLDDDSFENKQNRGKEQIDK